jgi:hypothetical protein
MSRFTDQIRSFFNRTKQLFINDKATTMEKQELNPGPQSENKIVEQISQSANQNVRNVMASFKKIGIGYKRLFTALYILGLGTLLFWLLSKYGLLETFVTYLAAFTVFYWLLVALFVWVRDGFMKKD